MMKNLVVSVGLGCFLFCLSATVNAALITIGTATYNSSDYNLIWDDDNNGNSVIWLDYTHYAQSGSGTRTNYREINNWVMTLEDEITINMFENYSVEWGENEWRLSNTGSTIPNDSDYSLWNDPDFVHLSELGHLFYDELGNWSSLQNVGGFNNIDFSKSYFTTAVAIANWNLSFVQGSYFASSIGDSNGFTLRNGQISYNPAANDLTQVPEPATILLFGTGLLGFIGVGLRKENTSI